MVAAAVGLLPRAAVGWKVLVGAIDGALQLKSKLMVAPRPDAAGQAEAVAGRKGEVAGGMGIVAEVDLRGSASITAPDEEVNMRRAMPVAADRLHQRGGGAARRDGMSRSASWTE